ncbi:hypothetical protein NDU88_007602 [Pleurodeles waltl]|uniref:Uncharacterized protein n=1 Tax=Pleurodeles waltl TaxID=8319 RepID=A0AAV7VTC3_PLEWA|nr:hypothetical protein NDU88_007602 [Pleurodeles waltl]
MAGSEECCNKKWQTQEGKEKKHKEEQILCVMGPKEKSGKQGELLPMGPPSTQINQEPKKGQTQEGKEEKHKEEQILPIKTDCGLKQGEEEKEDRNFAHGTTVDTDEPRAHEIPPHPSPDHDTREDMDATTNEEEPADNDAWTKE